MEENLSLDRYFELLRNDFEDDYLKEKPMFKDSEMFFSFISEGKIVAGVDETIHFKGVGIKPRNLAVIEQVITNKNYRAPDNAVDFKFEKSNDDKELSDINYRKLLLLVLKYVNQAVEDKEHNEKHMDRLLDARKFLKSLTREAFQNSSAEEKNQLVCAQINGKGEESGFAATNYYEAVTDKELVNPIKLNEYYLMGGLNFLDPYDIIAMSRSEEAAAKAYGCFINALNIKQTKDMKTADVDDDKISKVMDDLFCETDYPRSIDAKKFYQVLLYRVLDKSLKRGEEYSDRTLYYTINMANTLKNELEKISKNYPNDKGVVITNTDTYTYNSKESKGEGITGALTYLTIDNKIISEKYDEAMEKLYELALDRAENKYDLLRKNKGVHRFEDSEKTEDDIELLNTESIKLNKELIANVIGNIDNPEDFVYLAYKKRKFITAAEMAEICNEEGLMVTPIMVKMISDIKNKAENDKDYLNNDGFARFVKGSLQKNNPGYMPRLLKNLYEKGNITADDITALKQYVEKYEIEEYCNLDMMKSDTKDLVYLYKKLNKEKIKDILVKKERFTEDEVKEFMSKDSAFGEDIDREKKIELQALYKYQKDMFVAKKAYKDPDELEVMMNELGELGLSSAVVIDLFKEGLIDEEAGVLLDDNFSKFYNAYTMKRFSKEGFKDYKDIRKFLNAYSHDKITLNDILKGYVKGDVPEEFYNAVRKDFEEKKEKGLADELVDNQYLKDLYNEATKKDSSKESYRKLEKYFKECNKYLDKKQQEEFYKDVKQKELKEIQEGRIGKRSLIKLGEINLLDNEVLGAVVDKKLYDVIESLMQKNVLGFDKSKYLFEDKYSKEKQSFARRDLLEKIFKESSLTNEEKMNILYETYAIEKGMSEEQKELNNSNFVYFLEKGLVKSIETYTYEKEEKTQKAPATYSTAGKPEQQKFPLLKRIGNIKSIDDTMIVDAKNNGFIFKSPKYDKVIIESLGKKGKGGKLQNDITNHRTYIMSNDSFEKVKSDIIENDGDGREIIFEEVIRIIREKEIDDGTWVNHRGEEDSWLDRISKKIKKTNDKKEEKEKNERN